MLSREKFKEYLNRLHEIEAKEDKFNKALSEFLNSAIYLTLDETTTLIADLLKELTHDENNMIPYFMYELNWGKDGQDVLTDAQGFKSSLTTLDELYDYLEMHYND